MPKKSAVTRQEAAEQSRGRLLQAGLELLGQKLGSPFDNIRSTEVARAAGFTPGAFYHHWPSQDDFRDDLRSHVGGQAEADESLERLGADMLTAASGGIVQAIKTACRREIEVQVAGPSWHVQLAMQASQMQVDLEQSGLQYHLWFTSYGEFYSEVMDVLEIELIPEVSLDWFVRTLGALNEGFSLQIRSGLSASAEGTGDDWQAYELAIATFITATMRRRDGKPITAATVAGKLEQLTD